MRNLETSKPDSALAQAIRLLERKEFFRRELRDRLLAAGWPEPEVETAMEALRSRRLLDDSRALEATIQQRSGKRAIGRDRLRAQLEAKGAEEGDVQSVMPDDDEERNRARALLEAKFPLGVEWAKAVRFLAARGFEPEIIESIVESMRES